VAFAVFRGAQQQQPHQSADQFNRKDTVLRDKPDLRQKAAMDVASALVVSL